MNTPTLAPSYHGGVNIPDRQNHLQGNIAARGWRLAFEQLPPSLLALVPVALAAIVYYPITENYFWADDFYNFYRLRNHDFVDFLLRPQGGHLLVVNYAILSLYYWAFGTQPQPYFWVVLLTHLVNVFLLFMVIRAVTASARLACFGAALWGTSPVLEGSLGWLSVYGHVLVATTILPILSQLGRAAQGGVVSGRACALWIILLLAASLSFGAGIGIAVVFPAVALLLLPPSRQRGRIVRLLAVLAAIIPLLYAGLHALFAIHKVAVFHPYVYLLPVMKRWDAFVTLLPHLFGYGITRTLSGTVWPNPVYPGATASLLIVLYAGVTLATVWRGSVLARRWIVACFLLSLGCYAVIAAGRAPAYMPERVASFRFDRYQYVAPVALSLALCVALAWLEKWIDLRAWVKNVLVLGWLAISLGVHLGSGLPIEHHDGARRETARVLATIRTHIDAAAPQKAVFIPNKPFHAMGPVFERAPTLFPGWAGVFVVFFPDNVVDGKRILFVEPQRRVIVFASRGKRSGTLLIGPTAAKFLAGRAPAR